MQRHTVTMVLWNIFSKPADRFHLSWSWVYEKIKPGMWQPESNIPDIYFLRVLFFGKVCPQLPISQQWSSLLILEEVTARAVTHELRSRKKHPSGHWPASQDWDGLCICHMGLFRRWEEPVLKIPGQDRHLRTGQQTGHTTSPSALLLPGFFLMSISVPILSPPRCRQLAPSQSHASLLRRCPEATLSPKVTHCIQKTIHTIETTIYFIMFPTLYMH